METSAQSVSPPAGAWKAIVHSSAQILLASDVAFRGLNGSVAEQELDLFQFTSRSMAQAGACPPQVVGCQNLDSGDVLQIEPEEDEDVLAVV